MMKQIEMFPEITKSLAKVGIKTKKESGPDMGEKVAPTKETVSFYRNPNAKFFRTNKNVLEPNRRINYQVLRHVAEKAWLINIIIDHRISKVRPFLRPSRGDQDKGFKIVKRDLEEKITGEEKQFVKFLTNFLLHTGLPDKEREDDMFAYVSKILRDLFTLDQVTCELQQTRGKDIYAYWAVDPATIYRVTEEGYNGDDKIRFVQEIDGVVVAKYTWDQMIFQYQSPRTDVDHSDYGYSKVEKAIELITTSIKSFAYNSGVFDYDNLPRGAILLDGDADEETVQAMEDYLVDVMSGSPAGKWKIPIIPSGGDGDKTKLQWIDFQNKNRDMEFSKWNDFIMTAVSALFGTDLEELGIKTEKSQSIMGENQGYRIEASKARALGDDLAFLTSHFNKHLERIDKRFMIEFTGYEKEDTKLKNESRTAELSTYKSLNDLVREADGKPLDPKDHPWAEIPGLGSTNVYQAWASSAARQQQEGQETQEVEEEDAGDFRDFMMGDDEEEEVVGKSIRILI
jgi:hypothetical protein